MKYNLKFRNQNDRSELPQKLEAALQFIWNVLKENYS